jgi:hypothetical protein
MHSFVIVVVFSHNCSLPSSLPTIPSATLTPPPPTPLPYTLQAPHRLGDNGRDRYHDEDKPLGYLLPHGPGLANPLLASAGSDISTPARHLPAHILR